MLPRRIIGRTGTRWVCRDSRAGMCIRYAASAGSAQRPLPLLLPLPAQRPLQLLLPLLWLLTLPLTLLLTLP